MIRLNLPKGPYEIPLPYGVTVTVRPLKTEVYEAARARMARIVADLKTRQEEAARDGLKLELGFDPTDRDALNGYSQALFTKALAQAGILSWKGKPVDGVPVTPEDVAELMDVPAIAEAFIVAYTRPIAALAEEGNASAPAPNGTTAGAPTTADGAGTGATPVPAANAA